MAQERIAVPNIGDSKDVDVVEVLVKVGDRVEREQTLIVLESEKASMDVPAPRAGVVKELLIKTGDKASEGTPILVLESQGDSDQPQAKKSGEKKDASKSAKQGSSNDKKAEPAKSTKSTHSSQGDKPQERAAAPKQSRQSGEAKPAKARGDTGSAAAVQKGGSQEQINVPNIGDSKDVDVVEVLVKVGDRVEAEQTLIVLESEKASMDVPAPRAGVVKELLIKQGDKASEGTPILMLQGESEQAEAEADNQPEVDESEEAESTDERDDSQSSDHGESSDADEQDAETGQNRTVPPVSRQPVLSDAPAQPKASLPYASPAIRRFARELGVDLAHVKGTARKGRITKDDVQQYVKQTLRDPRSALAPTEGPDIDFSQFGPINVQALTKIQKLTGRNLHRSWTTIPHVTQFDEADITELEEFRKQIRSEQPGLKLTLVTFFMKALVHALKRMPRFNSSLDKSGENLVLKQYFHIGVAVDTPNGLVVPVIRDVDRKGLTDLAKELETISERARTRKLTPSDMQGASMSISSLGGIGGTAFTPIINPPEVAILGVSRARTAPVIKNGSFVPRLLCPLSLSYDHRVIDGADGARFTTLLGEFLSDIRQLLL
jgi:pyruvate dehydrogenase E2 component (dihydrolipoamide acetyltransferase)